MEPRLSLVTLGVADLARSIAFYERLGWRRRVSAAEGVAFFPAGGVVLALFPASDLAAEAGLSPEPGRPGMPRMSLAHNTRSREEVDAVLAEALAAGAGLLASGRDMAWGGYVAHFADPDGHVWEVAWNPGFPLADDGTLLLPE